MKKFISIFMSFVMLLSVITSVNMSAFAAEIGSDSEFESNQKQVVRVRLNPEPDYSILKNSNGEYKEENGVKTWWYNPNEFVKFNSDDTLKINYKKDSVSSVAIFSYSKVKDAFVDPLGETITYSMKEFTYSSESSNKFVINFKLPSNYYVVTDTGLKVDNYELEVNVAIHDYPIIDFQPLNGTFVVYDKSNGHIDESDNSKWHYDVVFRNGDSFKVDYQYKDSNGKPVIDTFKYTDGKFLNSKNEGLQVEVDSFDFDSQLNENEPDNKTEFTVRFPDFKVDNKAVSNTYSVTVAKNPTFTFVPNGDYFNIAEKSNGSVDEQNADKWWYDVAFKDGDAFVVDYQYKDNSNKQVTDTFTYTNGKFINNNNEELKVTTDKFSFDGALKNDKSQNTTKFTAHFVDFKNNGKAVSDNYDVTITPSPTFTFKPNGGKLTVFEKSNGNADNEKADRWWYNVEFNDGDTIEVNYNYQLKNNDVTDTFTYKNGAFFNNKGKELKVETDLFYFDGELKDTDAENTVKFTVLFPEFKYNKNTLSSEFDVTIVKNPITSLVLTTASGEPYEIIANTNGEEINGKWYYNQVNFQQDDLLTINYSNGTKIEYKFDKSTKSFTKDTETVEVEVLPYLCEKDKTGNFVFNLKLKNYGVLADVPVRIVENPIASFEFLTSYTLDKDKNAFKDDEGVYYKNPVVNGSKIRVNYKNGEHKDFTYTERKTVNGKVYVLLNGTEELNISIPEKIRFDGPFEKIEGQTDKVGNPIVEAVLTEYNVKAYIPIKIIEKAEAPAPDPKPNPDPQPTPSPSPSPSPAPEEPKKDEEKKPEQKPSNNQTANSTAKKYAPAKVKLTSVKALDGHKLKVKWEKCTTSATGYQIYWSKNKSFTKVVAKTQITGRRYTTYTGKNFTKNKKYYVKIRAFKKVNGKTYYGAWSDVKSGKAK